MTAADYRLVWESIVAHEDFSPHPIPDSRGSISIGFGRSLTFTGITRDEAAVLLEHDLERIQAAIAKAWPTFLVCDGPRQRVVMEMAYQVGVEGLLQFRKMLHAIAVRDYQKAAREVIASTLAHQTPSRARDYARTLGTP
jgi:lysozyme